MATHGTWSITGTFTTVDGLTNGIGGTLTETIRDCKTVNGKTEFTAAYELSNPGIRTDWTHRDRMRQIAPSGDIYELADSPGRNGPWRMVTGELPLNSAGHWQAPLASNCAYDMERRYLGRQYTGRLRYDDCVHGRRRVSRL